MTKDEKFITALYQMHTAQSEEEFYFDRYTVGQAAGLSAKGVDAICAQLIRTNFIKRERASPGIQITEQGIRLAKALLLKPD